MLAAVTVTVAMRTVGLLLVSALMVVPVATAQQLDPGVPDHAVRGDGPRACWPRSAASRVSAYVDVAPGATIVLLALAGFARRTRSGCGCAAAAAGGAVRRARRRRSRSTQAHTAVPEEHAHEHGQDCGHPAVPHGDHVDYVHDGHRHAPTESHYDEH